MLLIPQVWASPALTESKEPPGGVDSPFQPLPQQATESLLLIPQVWFPPGLTETKEPTGALAWPARSPPQQATEPLLLTPQVWTAPALTEMEEPAGGVASPDSLLSRRWRNPRTAPACRRKPDTSQPQQATEPLLLTPQVWNAPALTETVWPGR